MREILRLPLGRTKSMVGADSSSVASHGHVRVRHGKRLVPIQTACEDCAELAWTTSAAFSHASLTLEPIESNVETQEIPESRVFCCGHCAQRWSWSQEQGWRAITPTRSMQIDTRPRSSSIGC